jgi:excisionase family DNA binding protein
MTALRAVPEPDLVADVLAELRSLRQAVDALGSRDTSPLLNAEQAGELLGVPKSWLLAEARASRIPHLKLGHYTRFQRTALLDWIDRRMVGPRPRTRAGS